MKNEECIKENDWLIAEKSVREIASRENGEDEEDGEIVGRLLDEMLRVSV